MTPPRPARFDTAAFMRLERDKRDAKRRSLPTSSWWLEGDFYARQREAQQERFAVAPRPYNTD